MILYQEPPLTLKAIEGAQLVVLVRLYRTVSSEERADLKSNSGCFRDSIHETAEKGFFFSRSDADRLGRWCCQNLGPHTTVFADAPANTIQNGRIHCAAQEGPGVYLNVTDLSQLSPATEVDG